MKYYKYVLKSLTLCIAFACVNAVAVTEAEKKQYDELLAKYHNLSREAKRSPTVENWRAALDQCMRLVQFSSGKNDFWCRYCNDLKNEAEKPLIPLLDKQRSVLWKEARDMPTEENWLAVVENLAQVIELRRRHHQNWEVFVPQKKEAEEQLYEIRAENTKAQFQQVNEQLSQLKQTLGMTPENPLNSVQSLNQRVDQLQEAINQLVAINNQSQEKLETCLSQQNANAERIAELLQRLSEAPAAQSQPAIATSSR